MKKYTLVSRDARDKVDLRDYEDIIIQAVSQSIPKARVVVKKDCYFVDPSPTQSEAVRIGREICQSGLKKHCISVSKLFCSTQVEVNNGHDQKPLGGHH